MPRECHSAKARLVPRRPEKQSEYAALPSDRGSGARLLDMHEGVPDPEIRAFGRDFGEYERSGQIMGRGSDELEGYDWPLDGEHYGPGQHPEIPAEIREPPGLVIEMNPKQGSLAVRVWC